ncbi:hypothetical protein ACJMK2_027655 [Sinanodonta woodiana]|uniref:Uncharacterized protein n=1 Tax=Sinanodonta woodiana TaxID=1069815 RepID=A0ABD3X878_SINWO
MDKEEAQFRQQFQAFPSSFNLEIKELKNAKTIERHKKKLEMKISSDEFESTTERVRIYNLLSFLCWRANERDDAYSYNMKALELDKENIVSLFNKLWMRREDGHLSEGNKELSKLSKSKPNLILIGNAEIAYCYSVFGPSYILRSKDMFEDVVRDMGEQDIDPITLALWKLDLGIIYRQLCNSGNMPRQGWENWDEEECSKRGTELLYEVACSDSPARWRGKCWASLADLLHRYPKGVSLNKYQTKDLFPQKAKDISVESLLDLAMQTCGEDSDVLKIYKAEEVLRKSLSIRNTSSAHHHLALVLKQRLKYKLFAKRGYDNKTSDRYDPVGTNIRHKTCLANVSQDAKGRNVSSWSSHRHDHRKQEFSNTKTRKTAVRNEKFVSATSKMLKNIEYSNVQADSTLQHACTKQATRSFAKDRGTESSNVHSRSSARHDRNKQEFSQTRTTVVGNEKSGSTTSEKETIIKYLSRQIDRTLQHTSTQQATRLRAKGLDRVFTIPEDEKENVQEILHHLNEAIELGNASASLDKGIVLRQIKKFEEAREAFLMTLKMEDSITAILVVSCYENIGACCRDIAEHETDEEKRGKWEADAVIYWRKALDIISSKEGNTLNFLKEELMSYPSLKDLFQHRELDVAMLKALADLGEILERPAETRSFLQEIRRLGGDEADDPTIISCEIKTLLKENRYEDAAQLLDKTETEGIEIGRNFRLRVYLECAFYLVNIGKRENACDRFKQAFHVNSIANSKFHIFLLYDEGTKAEKNIADLAEKLDEFLSGNFGLRITRNSQNVKPGKQTWKTQTEQMESSKHIVLIINTNEIPPGEFEHFIGITQEISKTEKSILNIILVDECTCPLQLTNFPRKHFESKQLSSKDDFIHWTRDFIFHLLRVDENEN